MIPGRQEFITTQLNQKIVSFKFIIFTFFKYKFMEIGIEIKKQIVKFSDLKTYKETIQSGKTKETLLKDINFTSTKEKSNEQKMIEKTAKQHQIKADNASNQMRLQIVQELIFATEFQSLPLSQQFAIKKGSQKQFEDKINKQQKDARSRFYISQIPRISKAAGITQNQQKQIFQFVLQHNLREIDLDKLIKFQKYRPLLTQIRQSFQKLQKQIMHKKKRCLPILSIIKNQITSLRVINIQYTPKIMKHRIECGYEISAFQLFKIVYKNPFLNQVTLKGVKVKSFQQFINQFNLQNHRQMKEQSWMMKLSPLRQLTLTIDADTQFDIKYREITLQKIDDFIYFCSVFRILSNITATIKLAEWKDIHQWIDILLDLWKCLRTFRKINIKIQVSGVISKFQASFVRSILFGELSSFKNIAQLSFKGFDFSPDFFINDFLVMEQFLNTLFQNNIVTHLQLINYNNFLIVPKITTLETIILTKGFFREQFGFLSEVIRTNKSLKYIKCSFNIQECKIDEQLFNQLQTLILENCCNISLNDILAGKSSNIKYLSMSNIVIQNLSIIFSKLTKLKYLSLRGICCENQLISLIPSAQLQQLRIWNNNNFPKITQQGLKMIDRRWSQLRNFSISNFNWDDKVDIFRDCQFKGLMYIQVDKNMLTLKNLQKIHVRGIKIRIFFQ